MATTTPPPAAFDAWAAIGKWDLAQRLIDSVGDKLPTFEHAITARVFGGPQADIRRVWYLALSVVFGKYRNAPKGTFKNASIQGQWDITAKACSLELVYSISKWESWFNRQSNRLNSLFQSASTAVGAVTSASATAGDPRASVYTMLHRGPEQLTIGGAFPDFLRPTSGKAPQTSPPSWSGLISCDRGGSSPIVSARPLRYKRLGDLFREFPILGNVGLNFSLYPFSVEYAIDKAGGTVGRPWPTLGAAVGNDGAVALPDAARVILTAEKSDFRAQPPTPPIDGQTRGDLVALVAQTLHAPCFLPEAPPCVNRATETSGVYVANAGADLSLDALAVLVNGVRTKTVVAGPNYPAPTKTPDGYPPIPNAEPNFK